MVFSIFGMYQTYHNIRCLVEAAINYGFRLIHFVKLFKVAGAIYHV
jgi:hypothetical protein